jgi:hypothetical protein
MLFEEVELRRCKVRFRFVASGLCTSVEKIHSVNSSLLDSNIQMLVSPVNTT